MAVLRKNGTRYETSFFACSGCAVMFLNAAIFDGWYPVSAETAAVNLPPIVNAAAETAALD